MAGHSQFKNIMYRKGAQDAKRSKLFAKLAREVTVATRLGLPEPAQNPRLRTAIAAARGANMPKDNIDRAIKRGTGGGDGAAFEEVRYEGYGPAGVAIIVDALTDNRNRTASEIRGAFAKYGGNLGESGSVSFMFVRIGQITYDPATATADDMFEAALEAGAEDVSSTGEIHEITCAPDDLHAVRESLDSRFGPPRATELTWKPQNTVPVDETNAAGLINLLEALEDSDDVRSVAANYEIADEVLRKLST